MSKHPLVESLGVYIDSCGYINPDDLERILEQAPVGYGMGHEKSFSVTSQPIDAEFRARLLCIEPIVKDTAEGLLKELVTRFKINGRLDDFDGAFVKRIEKLLGDK